MKDRLICRAGRAGRGFTLIELLVVISIIALLIAILLPTLSRVKRQMRVMFCSTNQKSQMIGLTAFATEDSEGHYPAHSIHGHTDLRKFYATLEPYLSAYQGRDAALAIWKDMIFGGTWEIAYDPMAEDFWFDWAAGPDPNYPEIQFEVRDGAYAGQYYRVGNASDMDSSAFLDSGNELTDGPPVGPGSARDAILLDNIDSENGLLWHTHLDIRVPGPVVHGSSAEIVAKAPRTENNVGYADGHVETRGGSLSVASDPRFVTWSDANWVMRGPNIRLLY